MSKIMLSVLGLAMVLLVKVTTLAAEPAAASAAPGAQPAIAASQIVAVTVYQGSAMVTREVTVPAGKGLMELVVSPLPDQVADTSLYTEGADGLRVLSTRFRTRAVQQDTRAAVRDLQAEIKTLQNTSEKLTRDIAMAELNLALYTKLEGFTAATMQTLTDKGALNAEAVTTLAKFITTSRGETAQKQVETRQQLADTTQQIEFKQRQLSELTAGTSRIERDAVITLDRGGTAGDAGKIRLNYLVNAVTWQPQYKIHAGTDADTKVHVEYLASIQQQSGEDWIDAAISLSTAEPMLNAAPPELLALELNVSPVVANAQAGFQPGFAFASDVNAGESLKLRKESQQYANSNNHALALQTLNAASALDQTNELLAPQEKEAVTSVREGPSVTFHLDAHYSVPSRADQQLIEVTRLDFKPDYFYKAVPVLTTHVYRQANLTNDSAYVFLPGDATMYVGKDFVGRMTLPLVALGDAFAVGFGVDPQIQVERTLVAKTQSVQGGNQVHVYDFCIRVSNLKHEKVAVQLWDRLPKADSESAGVTLLTTAPELSSNPQLLREEKPKNLLRWDLNLDADTAGDKAAAVNYEFKLEYARGVTLGNFKVSQ